MSQTRKQSLGEAVVNVAIGWAVSFAANLIVLPLFGLDAPVSTFAAISVVFTAISIARSYLVRRFFNWRHT